MSAPKIVTLAEARARRLRHYFTGRPCIHGHVARRYVSTGTCAECLRVRARLDEGTRPKRDRSAYFRQRYLRRKLAEMLS